MGGLVSDLVVSETSDCYKLFVGTISPLLYTLRGNAGQRLSSLDFAKDSNYRRVYPLVVQPSQLYSR